MRQPFSGKAVMNKDDFFFDDKPAPVQTTHQDDFWANDPAPTPEVSTPGPTPLPEHHPSEEKPPPKDVEQDELALQQLSVLDVPEPSAPSLKNILPVRDPPAGDPDDLANYQDIFSQKLPVRVIQHPNGDRRIVVGTGGGVESYISEIWAEQFPSVVPAHRIPPGRRIVMTPYRVGVGIKLVFFGKGTAYLLVTDQGLRLVKKAIYQGR